MELRAIVLDEGNVGHIGGRVAAFGLAKVGEHDDILIAVAVEIGAPGLLLQNPPLIGIRFPASGCDNQISFSMMLRSHDSGPKVRERFIKGRPSGRRRGIDDSWRVRAWSRCIISRWRRIL